MLTFICWLWSPLETWKRDYNYQHVNALERMLKKYVKVPHRLICIGDNPEGINCEFFPIWDDPIIETKQGLPNCYRRLKMFSQWAQCFGDTIISIDLDCVIFSDITDMFAGGEEFRIVKGQACPYNGSMWMLKTGSRKQVWENFDPDTSPNIARSTRNPITNRRYFGSDQAWISYAIPGESIWTNADGVYHFRTEIHHGRPIPDNCRIMFFAGGKKPWHEATKIMNPKVFEEYQKYLVND